MVDLPVCRPQRPRPRPLSLRTLGTDRESVNVAIVSSSELTRHGSPGSSRRGNRNIGYVYVYATRKSRATLSRCVWCSNECHCSCRVSLLLPGSGNSHDRNVSVDTIWEASLHIVGNCGNDPENLEVRTPGMQPTRNQGLLGSRRGWLYVTDFRDFYRQTLFLCGSLAILASARSREVSLCAGFDVSRG